MSAVSSSPTRRNPPRTAVRNFAAFAIVAATAPLATYGGAVLYAQGQDKDKYSLKSPSGIAFSDFRGYEDWSVVSSARTDEILKVIVANPKMIKSFKGGVPVNGQPFPEGSMIVKLQWKLKKSTEAPFVVEVPDVFAVGDTRCSTTKPHRTSSRPIPKASQTADTRAIRQ